MAQTLDSQLVPVTSIDVYRSQHSPEPSQSYLPSAKSSRNRGVILSHQGWQKLMQARVLCDEFENRYSFEQLSERSRLDRRSVSRLLSCEVKVDKRTIKTFFSAFNLSLEIGDYVLSKSDETIVEMPGALSYASLTRLMIKFEQIVEEVSQLKQYMRDYDRLFQIVFQNCGKEIKD